MSSPESSRCGPSPSLSHSSLVTDRSSPQRIYLDLWRNRHSFIASLVVVGVSISKPLPFGEPTGDALAAAVAEIHSIRPKSVWSTPAGVHLLTALSDAQNASEPELPLINLSALMTSAALPLVDTFCTDFWTSFSTSVGSLADAGTGPAADVEKLLVEAAKRAQRAGDEARRSAGRKERHGSLQAGDSGGGGGARRGEGASDRDDRDSLSDGQVAEPAYSTGCSSPAQPMTPSPRDASFSPSSRSPRRTRSRSRATSVSPTPSTSSASGAARNAVAPSNSSAPLSPSQRRRTRSIDSTSETSPPLSKRPRFSAFAALVRPEEQIISTGHLTAGPAAETPAHLQDLEIEDIDEVANVIGTRQSEFAASQSLPMYLLALQFIPFALSSNARSASPSPFPPPSPSPLPPASLRSRSPSPSPADIRYLPSTSEGQRLLRNLTAGNALSPLSNFLRTNAPLSIAEYAALLKESPIDVSIASVIAHLAQGAFLLDHLRAKRERELDDWVDALQAFSDEWEGKGGRPYTARSDWSDIRRTGALQLGAEGVYRPSAKALFRRHGLTEV